MTKGGGGEQKRQTADVEDVDWTLDGTEGATRQQPGGEAPNKLLLRVSGPTRHDHCSKHIQAISSATRT